MSEEIILLSTVTKLLLHTPKGDFVIHEGEYNYPRSTWDENQFYVVARKAGPPGNRLLVFDKGFNLLKDIRFNIPGSSNVYGRDFMVGGLHENFYWDGWVYFANTGFNSVVRWSADAGLRLVYEGEPKQTMPWDVAKDNHLNSIWCDGKNFYVVEHRGGPSRVRVFDLEWNMVRTHWGLGEQAHNVYLEGNAIYVNSSYRHAMAIRNLKTGGDRSIYLARQLAWRPQFHGEEFVHMAYPRGLARTKDRWYIGLSATVSRGDRQKGDSCVMVFDNRWHKTKEMVFDNTGGIGTGGVRLMSETDYAHNRILCPWDGTVGGKGVL